MKAIYSRVLRGVKNSFHKAPSNFHYTSNFLFSFPIWKEKVDWFIHGFWGESMDSSSLIYQPMGLPAFYCTNDSSGINYLLTPLMYKPRQVAEKKKWIISGMELEEGDFFNSKSPIKENGTQKGRYCWTLMWHHWLGFSYSGWHWWTFGHCFLLLALLLWISISCSGQLLVGISWIPRWNGEQQTKIQ